MHKDIYNSLKKAYVIALSISGEVDVIRKSENKSGVPDGMFISRSADTIVLLETKVGGNQVTLVQINRHINRLLNINIKIIPIKQLTLEKVFFWFSELID